MLSSGFSCVKRHSFRGSGCAVLETEHCTGVTVTVTLVVAEGPQGTSNNSKGGSMAIGLTCWQRDMAPAGWTDMSEKHAKLRAETGAG